MNRTIVMWAAALGCIAIILGALGAHALKESLSADSLSSFTTGVRYQAWHSIALLALGLSNIEFPFEETYLSFMDNRYYLVFLQYLSTQHIFNKRLKALVFRPYYTHWRFIYDPWMVVAFHRSNKIFEISKSGP